MDLKQQTENEQASGVRQPLVQAFLRICKYLDINTKDKDARFEDTEEITLEKISRRLDVRIRQVTLSGEWWKTDGGALLAFLDEDEEPVALLPKAPGRYQLYRPVKGTTQPVDRSAAARLSAAAYSLYRPFPSDQVSLRELIRFGYENFWRRDLLAVILTGALGGALGMVVPLLTGVLFDYIVPGHMYSQLVWLILVLSASGFASLVFELTSSRAFLRMESRLDMNMEAALWDRILKLPSQFFRDFSAGDLAQRTDGISSIRNIVSDIVLNTVLAAVFSIFNLGLVFAYSVNVGLIVLGSALITVSVNTFYYYRLKKANGQQAARSGKLQGLLYQLIRGIPKFIISGAEKAAFDLWHKQFSELKKVEQRIGLTSASFSLFFTAFPIAFSMAIFAATYLDRPLMSEGKYLAMIAAASSFMEAMLSVSDAFNNIAQIKPIYGRMRPILETLPEINETKKDPGRLQGNIELSNVVFKYPGSSRNALEDISFHVKAGEMVAFVGASGSGKSTMVRLLLGFEKPLSGQIFYDGADLDTIDVREVRNQIGVVIQNAQIMSGDIYENIIGASNLTIEDAWEAARQVSLDRDIEKMPMGMHTCLNEGGRSISGGQLQRLLIARALVKKPAILVLDEATSALDNVTQAVISENLNRLKITRVVIAHRLSTIKNADQILVFDQGKIVQSGTYEELMSHPGPFMDLAKRQIS